MTHALTINLPDKEIGVKVEIDGLGVFENGSTNTVHEEDLLTFVQKHVKYSYGSTKNGKMTVKVSVPKLEEILPQGVTLDLEPPEDETDPPVVSDSQGPGEDVNNEGDEQ